MILSIQDFIREVVTPAIQKLSPEKKAEFRQAWLSQVEGRKGDRNFLKSCGSTLTETRMPKPATPVTLVNDAARKGVSIARFRITKAQGEEIKRIEREQSHDAALEAVGNVSGSSEFLNSSSVYKGNLAVKQNSRKSLDNRYHL